MQECQVFLRQNKVLKKNYNRHGKRPKRFQLMKEHVKTLDTFCNQKLTEKKKKKNNNKDSRLKD